MTKANIDTEVAAFLAKNGQRYTTKRQQLVTILGATDRPLTINDILRLDSSLAQSSVYRNLVILEAAGAVKRIATRDDFARYELAEMLTEHHHHLICSDCGDVADFALGGVAESDFDRALTQAAKQVGFSIQNSRLDLHGTCEACT